MNPELPPNPREELEARVTALLLGELSAAEAASMRELIAKDAELGRLRDRLSLTLDLLRETAATPVGETPLQPASLKLSPARREKLLAHFKTIAPKEFAPPPQRKISTLVELAAAAAVVLILASMLLPALSRSKSKSMRMPGVNSLSLGSAAASKEFSAGRETRSFGSVVQRPAAQLDRENGRHEFIALPGEKENLAALNAPAPTQATSALALGDKLGVAPITPAAPANQIVLEDMRERRLSENKPAAAPSANRIVLPQANEQQFAEVNNLKNDGSVQVVNQFGGGGGGFALQTREQPQAQSAAPVTILAAPGGIAGTNYYLDSETAHVFVTSDKKAQSDAGIGGRVDRIAGVASSVPRTKSAATSGSFSMGDVSHVGSLFQNAQKEKIAKAEAPEQWAALPPPVSSAGKLSDQIDAPLPHPALPAPVPQAEVLTRDNAFTTFSLNVSDVAFKLAAASLQNGVMPEAASMRSEEFINAFDYRDPEPAPGAPIGFAWERAGDPFAHNRDVLRFSIKTAAQGRQAGRPLNLVLLLDKSGSMERADRVEIISQALRVLASQLQPQDTLSVVVFARTARLFVDGVPGSQAGNVARDLRSLTPEGGTNLEEAMKLAYATALRHYLANGENRVVLLTDGAANLGNVEPDALKQKAETNRKQGIALDCFGVGWDGYNDNLLETLSRAGNGRYGFINTPEEAATEFAGKLAGALRVAAADVKVQVEFNPNRVTSYRQIGYAKDQLKKEDFRDNSVRAAQIGAAESGNALYTVEINPAGEGPLGTVHVRFRVPGTTDYQEHEWTVPYTGSAVPLEKASAAMRLAATAASFSEWLAGSPHAGGVTPDRLLVYLTGVPQVYGADDRPAKLEWMILQARRISGK
jgi:Mg-chelatase subunit ChlD